MTLDRITFDPEKMSGRPCIRGLRLPVDTVLRCLASGMSVDEVLEAYPDLQREDVQQALEFAAQSTEQF